MAVLFDKVKQFVLNTGVGSLQLGAPVAGYRGFPAADGQLCSMLIQDVGAAWEVSEGYYVFSNNTITRVRLIASSTGSFLNLSGNAIVSSGAKAQDYTPYEARSLEPMPKIADFSIQNISGGVTFTDTPGGIACVVPAGQGSAQASLFKPIPTTPCSIYMRFKQAVRMLQFSSFDFIVLNNSNGRCQFLEISSRLQDSSNQWQLGLLMGRDNSLSSFNATVYTQTFHTYPLWYRWDIGSESGGLLAAYCSVDGYNWNSVGEDWSSNFVGNVTHVGFASAAAGSPSYSVVSAFTSIKPV